MSQKSAVLAYLKKNKKKGITQLEATFNLLVLRLSERIRELEFDGVTIQRRREGNHVRYTIA